MKKLFSELELSDSVLNAIATVGYTEMTEIQAKAIPVILEGKDVIGRSGTGTGKTAAFGIPSVERMDENATKPQVLILSPTRELAMQTAEELKKFARYCKNIKVATIFGGENMMAQIRQLKTANVVIGTPGRIMDHMNRRTLKLDQIKTVVLDEADEMLNMGFLEDMQFILAAVPETRQTLLFSATMPPQIMKLTSKFLNDPVQITAEQTKRSIDNIQQFFYDIPQAQKREALNILLQMYGSNRAVVFCNTKSMVDTIVEYLNDNGFKAVGLHGDMKQIQRTQVMNSFRTGKLQVLVATDVAARGIDIDDVKAVFNFDLPMENEYYVHRIGRTGRAGKTGTAHSLVTKSADIRKIHILEKEFSTKIVRSKMPDYNEILEKKRGHVQRKVVAAINKGVNENWISTLELIEQDGFERNDIICALFELIAEKSSKVMPKNVVVARMDKFAADKPRRFEPTLREERIEGTNCLRVNVGKKNGVAPNHILGALIEETGVSKKAIGRIAIHDDYTDIQTTLEDALVICEKMHGKKIHGCPVDCDICNPDSDGASAQPKSQDRRSGYGKSQHRYSDNGGRKSYDKKPSSYAGKKHKSFSEFAGKGGLKPYGKKPNRSKKFRGE